MTPLTTTVSCLLLLSVNIRVTQKIPLRALEMQPDSQTVKVAGVTYSLRVRDKSELAAGPSENPANRNVALSLLFLRIKLTM